MLQHLPAAWNWVFMTPQDRMGGLELLKPIQPRLHRKWMEYRESNLTGYITGWRLLAGLSSIKQQPGFQGFAHNRNIQILHLYPKDYARNILQIACRLHWPLVLLCNITTMKEHKGVLRDRRY